MPVRQIERHVRPAAGQQVCGEDNAFIKGEGGKEGLHLLRLRTEIRTAAFGRVAFFAFYNVVVAVEQIQTVFLVKLFEKPEDIAVDVNDGLHISVFPEFISISQFNIGKTLSVIMLECSKIQMLVF